MRKQLTAAVLVLFLSAVVNGAAFESFLTDDIADGQLWTNCAECTTNLWDIVSCSEPVTAIACDTQSPPDKFVQFDQGSSFEKNFQNLGVTGGPDYFFGIKTLYEGDSVNDSDLRMKVTATPNTVPQTMDKNAFDIYSTQAEWNLFNGWCYFPDSIALYGPGENYTDIISQGDKMQFTAPNGQAKLSKLRIIDAACNTGGTCGTGFYESPSCRDPSWIEIEEGLTLEGLDAFNRDLPQGDYGYGCSGQTMCSSYGINAEIISPTATDLLNCHAKNYYLRDDLSPWFNYDVKGLSSVACAVQNRKTPFEGKIRVAIPAAYAEGDYWISLSLGYSGAEQPGELLEFEINNDSQNRFGMVDQWGGSGWEWIKCTLPEQKRLKAGDTLSFIGPGASVHLDRYRLDTVKPNFPECKGYYESVGGYKVKQLSKTLSGKYPGVSSDGSKVAYVDDWGGTNELKVMDWYGSNPLGYASGSFDGESRVEWAPVPGDNRVVLEDETAGQKGLKVIELATGAVTPIPGTTEIKENPTWFLDGSGNEWIIASGLEGGNYKIRAYQIDSSYSVVQTTEIFSSSGKIRSPTISPNKKWLAFFFDDPAGNPDIYVIELDPSNFSLIGVPTKLTDYDTMGIKDLRWSPNGQYLAFSMAGNLFLAGITYNDPSPPAINQLNRVSSYNPGTSAHEYFPAAIYNYEWLRKGISWFPNSEKLVVGGYYENADSTEFNYEIMSVDVVSQDTSEKFYTGALYIDGSNPTGQSSSTPVRHWEKIMTKPNGTFGENDGYLKVYDANPFTLTTVDFPYSMDCNLSILAKTEGTNDLNFFNQTSETLTSFSDSDFFDRTPGLNEYNFTLSKKARFSAGANTINLTSSRQATDAVKVDAFSLFNCSFILPSSQKEFEVTGLGLAPRVGLTVNSTPTVTVYVTNHTASDIVLNDLNFVVEDIRTRTQQTFNSWGAVTLPANTETAFDGGTLDLQGMGEGSYRIVATAVKGTESDSKTLVFVVGPTTGSMSIPETDYLLVPAILLVVALLLYSRKE